MNTFEKRKEWTSTVANSDNVSKAVRRSHPGFEDSDPPPSIDMDYALAKVSKRSSHVYTILGAVGGIIAAVVASVAYLETRPSREFVVGEVNIVRAEDRAVHHDTDERLKQLDNNVTRILTILESQGKSMDEIKRDMKEDRNRPGRR